MLMARIVNNLVVEVQPPHPDGHDFADCFPPETAALFVQVPDDTEVGDSVIVVGDVTTITPAPRRTAPPSPPEDIP